MRRSHGYGQTHADQDGWHPLPGVLPVLQRDCSGGSDQSSRNGEHAVSSTARPVDLTQVSAVPWAWVDEHVYAAIRGCSVKVLQTERRLNTGCRFRRMNGTTVRYKLGDIWKFLESQPGGGGAAQPNNGRRPGPGRPRRISP
jgi:hypothetical protein